MCVSIGGGKGGRRGGNTAAESFPRVYEERELIDSPRRDPPISLSDNSRPAREGAAGANIFFEKREIYAYPRPAVSEDDFFLASLAESFARREAARNSSDEQTLGTSQTSVLNRSGNRSIPRHLHRSRIANF